MRTQRLNSCAQQRIFRMLYLPKDNKGVVNKINKATLFLEIMFINLLTCKSNNKNT